MTRPQLEHIIRAAAANANVREIVVIGSQSILGSHPAAPPELTESIEADVFPKDLPERSIVVDGAMGELSLFHETFGYYAHGVDEKTAILPEGWRERLIKVESASTMGSIGWCLDPHDLAVSKLAAGREKDFRFVQAMLVHSFISMGEIRRRLKITPGIAGEVRELASARLDSWLKTG